MTDLLLAILAWATGTEYVPVTRLEESQRRVRILERNISDLLWKLEINRTILDALREDNDRLTAEKLDWKHHD